MKKYIDFILELFKIGKAIEKAYRRSEDAKRKEEIRKAIKSIDGDELHNIIVGRPRTDK